MSLEFRLSILRDGGQISPYTYQQVFDAITWFATERKIALTEENASMFVTHLAIALERITKGESVAPLDTMLLAEIAQSSHYAAAQAITAELQRFWGIDCPENELGYILLHLCTLLDIKV